MLIEAFVPRLWIIWYFGELEKGSCTRDGTPPFVDSGHIIFSQEGDSTIKSEAPNFDVSIKELLNLECFKHFLISLVRNFTGYKRIVAKQMVWNVKIMGNGLMATKVQDHLNQTWQCRITRRARLWSSHPMVTELRPLRLSVAVCTFGGGFCSTWQTLKPWRTKTAHLENKNWRWDGQLIELSCHGSPKQSNCWQSTTKWYSCRVVDARTSKVACI